MDYLARRFPDPARRAAVRVLVNDSLGAGAKPVALRHGDHLRIIALGRPERPIEVGSLGLLASSIVSMTPAQLLRERERLSSLFSLS